jgi:S1-C subfamily serine protease
LHKGCRLGIFLDAPRGAAALKLSLRRGGVCKCMRHVVTAFMVLLSAACATQSASYDSPISGTIGVVVANRDAAVVVTEVRTASAAARAGIRSGDRIRRCNGDAVESAREFERKVLDSRPGTIMRLDIGRGDESYSVELPVEEILTATLA